MLYWPPRIRKLTGGKLRRVGNRQEVAVNILALISPKVREARGVVTALYDNVIQLCWLVFMKRAFIPEFRRSIHAPVW